MHTRDFSGKKVVVMGLGRFGGGIAAARWLAGQGAQVMVTDLAPAEKLTESLARLEGLPVRYRLGGHDERDLEGCELLVVSPAVPRDWSPFVRAAVERGIPLSSEMNLFVERCPVQRVIGVTGSAGKSTTTAMIGAMLEAAQAAGVVRRAWVGGNIGHSLLADLPAMQPEDVMVLELSSFQLDDLGSPAWSPPVAVVTNIQPNHLDRHGTLEVYALAKMNIVRHQSPDGVVIVHAGDSAARAWVARAGAEARVRECRLDAAFRSHLQVPGPHNQLNAAAAVAAVRAVGISDEYIAQGLTRFHGLPHRLEFTAERGGVRYYNDSKSTTPESTCIAVEAFEAPVIVLVGGRGKGMPFTTMAQYLTGRAKAVVCYGEAGPEIYEEVLSTISDAPARAVQAGRLAEALEQARKLAAAGDVVVLSPACTSYDEFANYEQRGEVFRDLVRAIPE